MPNKTTKILLLTTLIGGILISISSNSWLGAWMGLEINLMSFIPLMSSQENIFTTEASLKYFLVQALASSTLLFLVVMKALINQGLILGSNIHELMIITPLLLKMGAAPLHWWFPSVMEGLEWMNCLLMMTVQKAAPMMLISYLMKATPPIFAVIMMSAIIGALGGMNQTSLRKILTYSSINHTGWMLMALLNSSNLWLLYFTVYTLLTMTVTTITKSFNISFINQTLMVKGKMLIKLTLFSTLLSLGGLPPFIGFMPKWMVIQTMIASNLTFMMIMMVMMSLVTLYYYLRICYSSFIILHEDTKWESGTLKENKTITLSIILASSSTMGLIMCAAIININ
uniref:NADH-ubiquinone oxidoreductase chain 2 n=1 Tax=Incisitermes nr. barretti TaxID=2942756 RepID=A0A8X8M1E0_9NEOP|nr:NADH dehydrogenase subunit 2 [Incisitermes nr. barretti]